MVPLTGRLYVTVFQPEQNLNSENRDIFVLYAKLLNFGYFVCIVVIMVHLVAFEDIDEASSESKATLADSIRRTLADEILAGKIQVNQRLDEQALADRFRVSRTPVREALRQLATTGLVASRPRRGTVVVPSDPYLIGEAFEAAAELEALTARRAAARATLVDMIAVQELYDACERAVQPEDRDVYASANREFHNKIGELARNASLTAATRIVRIQTAPYQRARFTDEKERRQSQSEHLSILEAICRQDEDAAYKAMKDHILRASLLALRQQKEAAQHT